MRLLNQFVKHFSCLICFVIVVTLISCNPTPKEKQKMDQTIQGELIIFHAGSLSVPFKQIADSFQQIYPEVTVKREAAGSVDCARKITDLNRQADIMASADYKVIQKLLIPGYTSWLIKFAANEMTLVYDDDSKYADEINQQNWMDILLREDVYYGRSDPDSDPCGYRTVIASELAEKYYKRKGFSKSLLAKDQNFIRPKETDLIALLESNALDYIFLYRSVARQHGLKYISLPDSVNLGNPDLKEFYSKASVQIDGKKPGETLEMKGEPMVYGVTKLKNAPNPKAAEAFLQFLLLDQKGLKMMEENGQPPLVPASTSTYPNIPKALRKFAKE